MLRKLIANLGIFALLAMLVPFQVSLAATVANENLITGLELSFSDGGSINAFNPTAGQIMTVNAQVDSQLKGNSIGRLVIRRASDNVTILDLANYVNGTFASIPIWDGKKAASGFCGSSDAVVCPDGDYIAEFVVRAASGSDSMLDSDKVSFKIANNSAINGISAANISTQTVSGSSNFDPSPKGGNNDQLRITYNLTGNISSSQNVGNLEIVNPDGRVVKSFATDDSQKTATFTWNGKDESNNMLVGPGIYMASLKISGGASTISDNRNFTVAYNNNSAPNITNFSLSSTTFDSVGEDISIEFNTEDDTFYTLEIRDSNNKLKSTLIDDETYSDNSEIITWDGRTSSGSLLSEGSYKIVLTAINDYGVAVETKTASIVDSTQDVPSSNSHINNIKCLPSVTFEPAEDEEIECEFDVRVDLDDLVVYAIRGGEKIELEDFGSQDEEDGVSFTWDGSDEDDEYVEEGTWLIAIESELDSKNLVAGKNIKIEYNEPQIDEFFMSKKDIDPAQDDVTYAIFKLDEDGFIDLEILEGNKLDETVEEDYEVEKDQWYAIEVDLSDYDEDDDIDIQLVAKSVENSSSKESEKISVDVNEDGDSSSRAEIHADIMSPIISDGENSFELNFNIDDDADVSVVIHKGKSSSGTKVIELMDVRDQDAGDFSICWDGKDSKGKSLGEGYYTYKITTDTGKEASKTGTFLIDDDIGEIVGGADGGCGSNDDDDDEEDNGGDCSGGSVASGVIIEGGNLNCGSGGSSSGSVCAGFSDVSANSSYCTAIQWAKNEGVFVGYGDGTFKPFQAINRAEILKVILEAQNVSILSDDFGTQGFADVIRGAWYMQYIRTAKQLGIFSGDGGKNTARPESTVNRAEVLKLVFETLRVSKGFDIGTCSSSYSDVESNAWYRNYACKAKDYALFGGGNFLLPGSYSTRGEVAQVLYDLSKAGLF